MKTEQLTFVLFSICINWSFVLCGKICSRKSKSVSPTSPRYLILSIATWTHRSTKDGGAIPFPFGLKNSSSMLPDHFFSAYAPQGCYLNKQHTPINHQITSFKVINILHSDKDTSNFSKFNEVGSVSGKTSLKSSKKHLTPVFSTPDITLFQSNMTWNR